MTTPHTPTPVRLDDHRYQVVPPLAADDLNRLRASIEANGYDGAYPVVVDEDGFILDGHHRATISTDLGVDFPTTTKVGLSEAEKRLYAISRNLDRRHLTDAQKVVLGMQIEPDIADAAKTRQGARTDLRTSVTVVTNVEPGEPGKTRTTPVQLVSVRTSDQVAKSVSLGSGRTYERGKKVFKELAKEDDAEQLMRRIASERWTLKDINAELNSRNPKRSTATSRAETETPAPGATEKQPDGKVWDEPWYKAQLAGLGVEVSLIAARREIERELVTLATEGVDAADFMGSRKVSPGWNKAVKEANTIAALIRRTMRGGGPEDRRDGGGD